MRIVSWNIERGYHPEETVNFLKEIDADIYCLYELDRGVKRTGEIDMFQIFKDKLNMDSYYVKEFNEIDTIWRKIIPWGGPGGGEIGNAIFTKLEVQKYYSVELPTNEFLEYKNKTWIPELFQPRIGNRKGQVVEIQVDDKKINIVGVHTEIWKSNWDHRKEQLETSLKYLNLESTILCGDFNNVSGVFKSTLLQNEIYAEFNKVRSWLSEKKLFDPFSNEDKTCGRSIFSSKIDWICGGSNIRITNKKNVFTGLSDHTCLIVDFEVI